MSTNKIQLFENRKVRSVWDENAEKWWFSIVDVIEVLTESPNPRKYWSVLKTRLKQEGSELATNCSQLKMQAADGKFYKTDVADIEQLFRLIQSIPSKKAEPFKLWLAKVGSERIDQCGTYSQHACRSIGYRTFAKGRTSKPERKRGNCRIRSGSCQGRPKIIRTARRRGY